MKNIHILMKNKAKFQSILIVGIGSSSGTDSSDSNENESEPFLAGSVIFALDKTGDLTSGRDCIL